MVERIPLTGSRGPYSGHDNKPEDDYIMKTIEVNLNGRSYVSHEIFHEEIRDGTIVHNGIEMPASIKEYYMMLETEEQSDPKGSIDRASLPNL